MAPALATSCDVCTKIRLGADARLQETISFRCLVALAPGRSLLLLGCASYRWPC